MFTGIITEIGIVKKVEPIANGKIFLIKAPQSSRKLKIGSSIALNGACHTVIKCTSTTFNVESILESLKRTNLKKIQPGDLINLELPLKALARLEGHIVSGHIDGTAKITKLTKTGRTVFCELSLPPKFAKFVVAKGSIALDGISFTLISANKNRIKIGIIPHTLAHTNLKTRQKGDEINFETDLLAKHLARLIESNLL